MAELTPKSDFIFADQVVPTKNVVLVVHVPDPETLDIWMPRVVTDTLTTEGKAQLLAAITDFLTHVPVRKA